MRWSFPQIAGIFFTLLAAVGPLAAQDANPKKRLREMRAIESPDEDPLTKPAQKPHPFVDVVERLKLGPAFFFTSAMGASPSGKLIWVWDHGAELDDNGFPKFEAGKTSRQRIRVVDSDSRVKFETAANDKWSPGPLAAISADDKLLAIATRSGTLVFDWTTGKLLQQFQTPAPELNTILLFDQMIWWKNDLFFAANDTLLVHCDQKSITCFHRATGKKFVLHDPDRWVSLAALSPDRNVLAYVAGWQVRVVDLRTEKQIASGSPDKEVRALSFSADGRYLVASCGVRPMARFYKNTDGRGSLLMLDLKNASRGEEVVAQPGTMQSVTFVGERSFVSWDTSRRAVLWSIEPDPK